MSATAVDVQTAHGSGSSGHDEHTGGHHTSTGIDSRKLGMWLFLASDCMFFGSLIATYMIYRGRAEEMFLAGQGTGPLPHEMLDIPYTSISAFVLLMSSLTMVLALSAVQRAIYARPASGYLPRHFSARSSSVVSSSSSPSSIMKVLA